MKDKAQELERAVQSNHPIKQLASHLSIFKLFHSSSIVNQFERQSTDVGEGSWPDQLIDPCLNWNCKSRSPPARIFKRVKMEFDLQKPTALTILCIDNGYGTNELGTCRFCNLFPWKKEEIIRPVSDSEKFFFSSLFHKSYYLQNSIKSTVLALHLTDMR